MDNAALTSALERFADSCDRLSAVLDNQRERDVKRTNRLVAGLAAITMTCVALVASGSISTYRVTADLNAVIKQENERWNGTVDTSGRRTSEGQLDFNVAISKALRDTIFEWDQWQKAHGGK